MALVFFFSFHFPDNTVGHPGLEHCSRVKVLRVTLDLKIPVSVIESDRHFYVVFRLIASSIKTPET